MTTFTLQAPAAFQTYVPKSGTNYTSNAAKILSSVAAVDVPDLLNDGCTLLPNGNGLPMVAGRFYGLPDGATQAAVLTVASVLYATPIFIPNAITLDKLYVSVTTGQTGGKARAALYYDNGSGYPGALVAGSDSGDLDATGTAVVNSAALALVVQPGWYWIATIFGATSTMPSVIGATATYANALNALLGSDTAAHALATSAQATTGIAKTSATYPATDMKTSFPTFPAGAALTINASTPIAIIGV